MTAERLVHCLDTETTGNDRELDEIAELACVPVLCGPGGSRALPGWEALCRTTKAMTPQALANHGIRPHKLRGRAPASWHLRTAGLGEACALATHNAEFDMPFLERSWRASGLQTPVPAALCTYRCSLHVWPEAPGHNLQVLRCWLGLCPALPRHSRAHRALYDAACCAALLRALLRERTLDQLLVLTTAPWRQMTIRIGEHRGKMWSDVPSGYLHWMWRTMQRDAEAFDPDTRHTAAYHLRRRGIV